MSTKFPLCIVLMELSSQLAERGLHLGLGWLPREAIRPADALTNSDLSEFFPEKRIEVQWTDLKFKVLDRLMVRGPAMLFRDQGCPGVQERGRPGKGPKRPAQKAAGDGPLVTLSDRAEDGLGQFEDLPPLTQRQKQNIITTGLCEGVDKEVYTRTHTHGHTHGHSNTHTDTHTDTHRHTDVGSPSQFSRLKSAECLLERR